MYADTQMYPKIFNAVLYPKHNFMANSDIKKTIFLFLFKSFCSTVTVQQGFLSHLDSVIMCHMSFLVMPESRGIEMLMTLVQTKIVQQLLNGLS